jgi:hypothetical protein
MKGHLPLRSVAECTIYVGKCRGILDKPFPAVVPPVAKYLILPPVQVVQEKLSGIVRIILGSVMRTFEVNFRVFQRFDQTNLSGDSVHKRILSLEVYAGR